MLDQGEDMAAELRNAARERLDASELPLGVILRQARTVDIAPIMKSVMRLRLAVSRPRA